MGMGTFWALRYRDLCHAGATPIFATRLITTAHTIGRGKRKCRWGAIFSWWSCALVFYKFMGFSPVWSKKYFETSQSYNYFHTTDSSYSAVVQQTPINKVPPDYHPIKESKIKRYCIFIACWHLIELLSFQWGSYLISRNHNKPVISS